MPRLRAAGHAGPTEAMGSECSKMYEVCHITCRLQSTSLLWGGPCHSLPLELQNVTGGDVHLPHMLIFHAQQRLHVIKAMMAQHLRRRSAFRNSMPQKKLPILDPLQLTPCPGVLDEASIAQEGGDRVPLDALSFRSRWRLSKRRISGKISARPSSDSQVSGLERMLSAWRLLAGLQRLR